jgi:hypothetical protein
VLNLKEYSSINMKPIFIIIAIFIFIGFLLENNSFQAFLDDNSFLRYIFGFGAFFASILISYFFIKGKTGQQFSWKLLLISILFSAIFIAFALLKKLS